MEIFNLHQYLRERNRRELLKAAFFGLAAIPLWYLSFWFSVVLLGMTSIWLPFGVDWVFPGAWVFMALLAYEGIRYGKQLFDMEAFANSYYNSGFTASTTEDNLRLYLALRGYHDPLRVAYVVSRLLFCAPRSTLNAWVALRNFKRLAKEQIDSAEAIFYQLGELGTWAPVADFSDHGPELQLLDQIGLTWLREREDQAEVRVRPSLKERYFEE